MKKVVYNLMHPNNKIVIIETLFIVLSLFYLIFLDRFNKVEAYILYLLMAYSFAVLSIKVYEIVKKIINFIIAKNKYLKIYRDNTLVKHKVDLVLSLTVNVMYVFFKLISGIIYKSLWFISFAIYYLILALARATLIKEELNTNKTLKDEYLQYRKTGIILLFINIFLLIIILIVVNQKIIISYNNSITITIAAYTFYLMTISIINMIKYHKLKKLLVSGAKIINIVISLVSMLSLEIVMLGTFGNEKIEFNEILIITTGGGIGIIIIIISLYMIIKSTKWLNKNITK